MMRVKSLLMTVALAVAALAMTGAPATAQAKKVIRINHAGADDIRCSPGSSRTT